MDSDEFMVNWECARLETERDYDDDDDCEWSDYEYPPRGPMTDADREFMKHLVEDDIGELLLVSQRLGQQAAKQYNESVLRSLRFDL